MPEMLLKFGEVLLPQRGITPDHKQVFRVPLLRCLCEVHRTGYDHGLVDDDDIVVGDLVLIVKVGWNPGIEKEISDGKLLTLLTLVQNHDHLNPTPVRIDECIPNRGGCQRIRLYEYLLFGVVEFTDDGTGGPTVWREVDLNGGCIGRACEYSG